MWQGVNFSSLSKCLFEYLFDFGLVVIFGFLSAYV